MEGGQVGRCGKGRWSPEAGHKRARLLPERKLISEDGLGVDWVEVGRIARREGYTTFEAAWRFSVRSNPTLHGWVIGDAARRQVTEDELREVVSLVRWGWEVRVKG